MGDDYNKTVEYRHANLKGSGDFTPLSSRHQPEMRFKAWIASACPLTICDGKCGGLEGVYTSTVRVRHTITCFAAPSDLDLGRSAPPRDMSRFSFRIKTGTRSMIPALVAMGVALILLYGA